MVHPILVLDPGIVDEVVEAAAHDFLDVDSMIHHSLSSLALVQQAGGTLVVVEVDAIGRARVFENLLMLESMDWRLVLLNFCMKLAKPNCTVYRISANRHRVGCWGRSSCTPCSGLKTG